jgi:bifunctional DNase/RNase
MRSSKMGSKGIPIVVANIIVTESSIQIEKEKEKRPFDKVICLERALGPLYL